METGASADLNGLECRGRFASIGAGALERRVAFALSIVDRQLHVSIGAGTILGRVERCVPP